MMSGSQHTSKLLKEACKQGNVAEVEKILDTEEISLTTVQYSSSSPVHIAVVNNQLEVLKLLLARGAPLDMENGLEILIRTATSRGHAELLEYILKHSSDILKDDSSALSKSLDLAFEQSTTQAAEVLIKNGAFPAEDDYTNYRIFRYFLSQNEINVIQILVEKSTDLDFLSLKRKASPLWIAVNNNLLEIAELLLKSGARVNLEKYKFEPPLHLATKLGYIEMMQLLLNYKADTEQSIKNDLSRETTPLGIACRLHSFKAIDTLIKHGANIDGICNKFGLAPLHIACFYSKLFKDYVCIEWLLKNKANVNFVTYKRETPIFFAFDKPEVVSLLLRYGADINFQNSQGETPLHKAISLNKMESAKILIKSSANLDLRTVNGVSTIHYAVKYDNYDLLRILLETKDIDINGHLDNKGNTPMHFVFSYSIPNHSTCKILNILLHYGGNIERKNWSDEVPRRLGCITDDFLICPHLDYYHKTALLGFKVDNHLPSYNLDNRGILRIRVRIGDNAAIEEHKTEIEELKAVLISYYPRFSLHDFLLAKRSMALKFSRNENLVALFSESGDNFENRFPHYGLLLNQKFKRAVRRRQLTDSATEALKLATASYLPEICSEKVFFHFNEKQLNVLENFSLE